jgi:Calx-beta domain-containing protein
VRLPAAFLTILVLFLAPCAVAATPQTFIMLNSQPGDWVGQGMLQTFTPSDGTFTFTKIPTGGVQVSFYNPTPSHFWNLWFKPPSGQAFAKAEYEGAQRFSFGSPTKPGMDIFGDGRGCNTVTGRFLVMEAAFDTAGNVLRLAIDFEQHCEGATPALFGSVRYNSTVSAIPRVSVGDAITLKGNVGTNDANVIVSLSLPSSSPVTVQYATVDKSALNGTDYVGSTGSVQFPLGVTSQNLAIPILGDRLARGNKNFQVKLSAPSGAPLGDGIAKVRILDPNVSMTVLSMSSQPGDYIGQGKKWLYTIADGVFTTSRNYDNGVSVFLRADDWWNLDFAGPSNATLTKGTYYNAQKYPVQPPGVPGLNVYGAGRGCNTLTGLFNVLRANYSTTGAVTHFSVDFEQHCEGWTPALFGSLRIASTLRQLSVGNAVIDTANSSAVFTVTLNPSSSTSVSVNFSTADGTAVAGVDYAATSQTVTFAPGQVAQTVSVPLFGSGGGKQFFGQLSLPSGSPIWIDHASATF